MERLLSWFSKSLSLLSSWPTESVGMAAVAGYQFPDLAELKYLCRNWNRVEFCIYSMMAERIYKHMFSLRCRNIPIPMELVGLYTTGW